MHDSSAPKRTSSDPTIVLDRALISDAAKKAIGEAIESYPDVTIHTVELLQNQEGNGDRETVVKCPACKSCACCQGAGVVTFTRALEWESRADSQRPGDSMPKP